jgi:FHA domain-containing protein
LRFQVRYPGTAPHDVELQGTVAVLGRDPSCDLVLSDSKCSRRHAVLEAGPQGIVIRDAGSANGIFVNDKKVERTALNEGDVIRLGDVVLKVLPEEMPGTLMMSPEEMEAGAPVPDVPAPAPSPPRPAAPPMRVPGEAPVPPARAAVRPAAAAPEPPPPPRPRPEPRARPLGSSASERPLTVTLLAVLWLASIVVYGLGGVWTAHALGWSGVWAAVPIAAGALLALVSAVMAYGLWSLAPWARVLQIVLAAVGLFFCPFTLASIAVLVYMSRAAARAAFAGRRPAGSRDPAAPADTSSEGAFAAVILGTVLLGVVASGVSLFLAHRGGGTMDEARASAREGAAVARLRKLAAAEAEFRSGACVNAYADLEGMLNPASAIPDYRPEGPSFLPPEFARAEALGYRFDLTVEEPVPPTEGCAARGFRRFAYTATPMDAGGRHLLVGPDGVVHAAAGRPATPEDPAVR